MENLFRVDSPRDGERGFGAACACAARKFVANKQPKTIFIWLAEEVEVKEEGRGTAVPYLPMRAACTSGCFYISFIIFSSFLFFFFCWGC